VVRKWAAAIPDDPAICSKGPIALLFLRAMEYLAVEAVVAATELAFRLGSQQHGAFSTQR